MFGHIPQGFYRKKEEERKELAREQLRDQFAMAALTGMLAANYSGDRVAKSAYQIADYMLEARKEKK